MTLKKNTLLTKSESLSEAWKERLDCTNGLAGTKFHNTWRSIVFTIKGKRVGCQESWKLFNNFKDDMYPSYNEGLKICRKDKKLPFTKENCHWVLASDLANSVAKKLEYNGTSKTLKEWCLEYDLAINGVRGRFYKEGYTPHEILFGKVKRKRLKITDHTELEKQALRDKASKMLSAYRFKDRKKGIKVDSRLTIEWFIENIMKKNCVYCGTDKRVGADRLDNKKAHAVDNIVPCCYRCNIVRQDIFSYKEMLKIGKFIREEIDNKSEVT